MIDENEMNNLKKLVNIVWSDNNTVATRASYNKLQASELYRNSYTTNAHISAYVRDASTIEEVLEALINAAFSTGYERGIQAERDATTNNLFKAFPDLENKIRSIAEDVANEVIDERR